MTINPDLVIPPQFRRTPGDRDAGPKRSLAVEQAREARRTTMACKRLLEKHRRLKARERRELART
jgi:hypothetical protein